VALPICLEIPELGDPPVITLPGGVSIQQFNLMEAIQPALTPLMPVFDIIDTVVAVFNCVKAIPDSLGPPPDPTALAACIPELAEKVSKLLKLIPQLSLPYTIIGIIDLVIDTLRQARDQLLHLQQQMQQILGAIDRATELEDAGLMAITSARRRTSRPRRRTSARRSRASASSSASSTSSSAWSARPRCPTSRTSRDVRSTRWCRRSTPS
jgi:hypothetical protein